MCIGAVTEPISVLWSDCYCGLLSIKLRKVLHLAISNNIQNRIRKYILTCWSHSGQDLVAILTFFVLFVDIVRFLEATHRQLYGSLRYNFCPKFMDGKIFTPTVPNTWVQETHSSAVKCQHTFTKHTHITVYQELNLWACARSLLLLMCCFQALWEKWGYNFWQNIQARAWLAAYFSHSFVFVLCFPIHLIVRCSFEICIKLQLLLRESWWNKKKKIQNLFPFIWKMIHMLIFFLPIYIAVMKWYHGITQRPSTDVLK